MSNNRKQNFEVLRVLSMFLIVVGHYSYHGLKPNPIYNTFNMLEFKSATDFVFMEPLWILATIGVNCFVLITGYFLIDKDKIRWTSLIKFYIQLLFYSIIIYVIVNDFSFKGILKFSTPIHSKLYWFMTMYFALSLIAPYLSVLIKNISKKEYVILLIILFVLLWKHTYGKIFGGDQSLQWMIFLFLFAGYIKKHSLPNILVKYSGAISLLLILIFSLSAIVINIFINGVKQFTLMSTSIDSLSFFLSVFVFIWFSKKKFNNRFGHLMCKITPYLLGVYLIHEHPSIREILWSNLIPKSMQIPMIVHCLAISLLLFCLCVCIDYLRSFVFIIIARVPIKNKLRLYI